MGKRARIGEAIAVTESQPPKMSKYAAKVAARRKETQEQKAERLGIIVKTVVEEPVKEESVKEEQSAERRKPQARKARKKSGKPKHKIPYELYAGWLSTAKSEHLGIVRDLEKRMRDEMRRWSQCRADFSHWAQGAEGTTLMTEYTKNDNWEYGDAEGDGHREEAGE